MVTNLIHKIIETNYHKIRYSEFAGGALTSPPPVFHTHKKRAPTEQETEQQ